MFIARPVVVVAVAGLLAFTGTVSAAAFPPKVAAMSKTSTATKGQLTTTLALVTTNVASGQPISASVTIVNRTSRSISYPSCRGDASLLVGIESDAIPFSPLSGDVYCQTVIHPGVNTFKEPILTTYLGCNGIKQPRCPANHTMPPLPAGTYHTAISWFDVPPSIPHPQPLTVVVRAPPRH
jgi:hypothetical protein